MQTTKGSHFSIKNNNMFIFGLCYYRNKITQIVAYEEAIDIEKNYVHRIYERNSMSIVPLQRHPKHRLGFNKPSKSHNTN